jgi:hypothetical protein
VDGWAQSQSGHYGEQKNLLPLTGIEPQPSSPQPTVMLTELSRLLLSLEGKDSNVVSDGKPYYLKEIQD